MKKILIAVDGGAASEKVASSGLHLGEQLNAEIALISVVDTTDLMTEGNITPRELADLDKKELTRSQQELVSKIFRDHAVNTFIGEGKPHEVILQKAEEWEADLIVLGTHGRTGLSHLILGSIAEKVIRHSAIPLYIIPNKP